MHELMFPLGVAPPPRTRAGMLRARRPAATSRTAAVCCGTRCWHWSGRAESRTAPTVGTECWHQMSGGRRPHCCWLAPAGRSLDASSYGVWCCPEAE